MNARANVVRAAAVAAAAILALAVPSARSEAAANVKLSIVNRADATVDLSIWGGGSAGLLYRKGITPGQTQHFDVPHEIQVNFSIIKPAGNNKVDVICKVAQYLNLPSGGNFAITKSGSSCDLKRA